MHHSSVNPVWIDQFSHCRTGWARFSADMTRRYRLARSLPHGPDLEISIGETGAVVGVRRIVWLLINPSTADAFDPDPTVTECRKRSIALGADVFEIVNLFALRSPYPQDLRKHACGYRGDDSVNNQQIMAACSGAAMVIAGWGNDGALDHRDMFVRDLLKLSNVDLHHLGTTKDGYPKHPLARGKHRIPAQQEPIRWSP